MTGSFLSIVALPSPLLPCVEGSGYLQTSKEMGGSLAAVWPVDAHGRQGKTKGAVLQRVDARKKEGELV